MKLEADWLHSPAVRDVVSAFSTNGAPIYFVGGCVRNALIGAQTTDIDMATPVPPEGVIDFAKAAGLKAIPTGLAHGTVTIVARGEPFEITTFRKDVETDGRRAVVALSESLDEDAHRRDFTMNAIYATPEGDLIDPLGGTADLRARRVRFIDDPKARIREDYLRILRFFRFYAWYGQGSDGPDAEALAACAALADGIEGLSRERVGTEMLKLLAAPDPSRALGAMDQAGILSRVLPGADCATFFRFDHLSDHLDPIARLAALGGQDAGERLRLSRSQVKRLSLLTTTASDQKSPAELAYRLGEDDARTSVILRAAMFDQPLLPTLEADVAKGAAAHFPVEAKDLMPRLAGPALGDMLKELERRWIASDFTLDKESLLSGMAE